MDQREREGDFQEMLLTALDALQARLWTSIPGIIETFYPEDQTADVQISIMGQIQNIVDGSWSDVAITLLPKCPVEFPSGGGFTLTFPVEQGDECVVEFSKATIDAWWQNGGVQPMGRYRVHDLSDGICRVGVRSKPRVLSGISTTTVQLRSDDGEAYVELASGHICNVVAPGGINLNGVTIDSSGNIATPGGINATGDILGEGVNIKTHVHSGVTTGSGDTGPPV